MLRPTVRPFLVLAGALTLLLTAGLLGISPDVAHAIPNCDDLIFDCFCPSGGEQQTAGTWGMGPDCSSAFQDFVAHARALMSCANGVCSETFVVTTACWNNNGTQQVDGYALYKCTSCRWVCL